MDRFRHLTRPAHGHCGLFSLDDHLPSAGDSAHVKSTKGTGGSHGGFGTCCSGIWPTGVGFGLSSPLEGGAARSAPDQLEALERRNAADLAAHPAPVCSS